ncbi:MAG: hypothetical protein Fur0035_09240 [Anaerolineales bacterium]
MTASATSRPRGPRRTFAAYLEAAGSLNTSVSLSPVLRQQWLVMFVGVVALLALVAGLYLEVTSRAAIAGRDIQNLEIAIATHQRANADLQTELAGLLSEQTLQARAEALGYQPLERADLDYILVPGYLPESGVNLTSESPNQPSIASQPAFQQSLLEWIALQVESASAPLPR